MKKAIFTTAALTLLLSAMSSEARIDFTLASKNNANGVSSENRYISDGDSHIYLRIPLDWKANGSPARLDFAPEQPSSSVQVSQVSVQALPLDPGGLAALRKNAEASIPEGAKGVTAAGEASDLLPVFGWKSFEATYDYEFFGQHLRRSMLYINMIPGRVIQVSVTALPADFDKVHEKMRKLMFGWFEPSRDLTPEQAQQYENGEFKGS